MKQIASTKTQSKELEEKVCTTEQKIYRTASRLWGIYVIICAVLFYPCAVYMIGRHYPYVELPNTVVLTRDSKLPGVVLKDTKGYVMTGSNVGKIIWNDQYVMGHRRAADKEVRFIYEVELPWVAVEDRDHSIREFLELVKKSHLAEKKIDEYQEFEELAKNPLYRRTWIDDLLNLLRRKLSWIR